MFHYYGKNSFVEVYKNLVRSNLVRSENNFVRSSNNYIGHSSMTIMLQKVLILATSL